MSEQPTEDRMEQEVAALVLDALHPAEADAVRLHLESCASCRELERRLGRAVAAVPLTVDEVTPPERLRQRILVAAGASPASTPAPTRRPVRQARPTPSRWSRFREGLRTMPQVPLRGAIAAVMLALVALVGWNVYLTRQLGHPPTLASTTSQHSILQTEGAWGNARGKITTAGSVNVVSFTGLPPLPTGHVYELWVGTSANSVQSAGVFEPEADGSKTLVLERDLSSKSLIAVTMEPGPHGTAAPTQSPQMVGHL